MATSETRSHPAKVARNARGERLVDVAGTARISVSYLSMIEHGLRPPAPVQERIANALELPVEEIFV